VELGDLGGGRQDPEIVLYTLQKYYQKQILVKAKCVVRYVI